MALSLVWTGWLIYRAQKSGWQPDVLTGLMTILLIIGGFGLGGVLTKTGLGTLVEQGKQIAWRENDPWKGEEGS